MPTGNRTHKSSWSVLGPPYRRLLRSAGATEDLFVTRELHQEPPPRIPKGYLMVNPQPPTLMRTLNQLDQSLLTLIPLFIDVLMAGVHLRLILYCSFGYFCPADVGKTPQTIASSLCGFNADQFKNLTVLFSLYALQGVLPQPHLKCCQKFVLACKFLCTRTITENNILLADRLLQFCQKFEQLYGEDKVTNMHLHCHLAKFLRNYGPIYSF